MTTKVDALEAWLAQEREVVARIDAGVGCGVSTPEQAAGRSGLELMQAMLRGELPYPPIAKTLDFQLLEADAGREVAMAVAKKLVVFLRRPGGQAQFSSALLEQSAGDERIGLLHRWIADHLREPIDVSRLAERVSMTPRTFARFYLQRTGTTPANVPVTNASSAL